MAMEYSPIDGKTKVELKSDLQPGVCDGKLFLIEDHDSKSAADTAADRFRTALGNLLNE
jgi:hypothetical protein